MQTIRNFWTIVDAHTVTVTVLALGSTYLCDQFGLAADIPTGLIGVAIIFPIVFSINAAYRRREEALKNFATLKSHAMALFFAHRDWVPDGGGDQHAPRAREAVTGLLEKMRDYFTSGRPVAGAEDPKLAEVYECFSTFSRSMETLRSAKVATGEISRANQYLRSMMIEFERMRNILAYRTPVALRAYSRVFLNIFPVLFGPYFAHLGQEYYASAGYLVAALYSMVLVSLDNIQERLENPFDSVGQDDLELDVAALYAPVMK
jgi:hypothetical protein